MCFEFARIHWPRRLCITRFQHGKSVQSTRPCLLLNGRGHGLTNSIYKVISAPVHTRRSSSSKPSSSLPQLGSTNHLISQHDFRYINNPITLPPNHAFHHHSPSLPPLHQPCRLPPSIRSQQHRSLPHQNKAPNRQLVYIPLHPNQGCGR